MGQSHHCSRFSQLAQTALVGDGRRPQSGTDQTGSYRTRTGTNLIDKSIDPSYNSVLFVEYRSVGCAEGEMSDNRPAEFSVSPDVLFRELEGESVLLDLATEQYYVLDDVGTRMWQLLAQHGEIEAVVRQLVDEYDASEDRLRGDLASLVAGLVEAGLVNACEP